MFPFKKQMEAAPNLSKLLSDTKILDPIENKMVLVRSLWEDNTKPLILIHWLRRFGWPLCRMGALDLTNALIDSKDKMKDSLAHVAIGLAKLDYEDFLKGDYFREGKIYIDEGKETYKALDFKSKGIFSFYGMLNPKMYLKGLEASSKGISGNLKGDGLQLGGTLIVDKQGNTIYKHEQSSYSDQPSIDDIVKAVNEYLNENKLM